jgi:hypothetical protein
MAEVERVKECGDQSLESEGSGEPESRNCGPLIY